MPEASLPPFLRKHWHPTDAARQDATAQRPAVPPLGETTPRPAISRPLSPSTSRPLGPSTLQLPAIPTDSAPLPVVKPITRPTPRDGSAERPLPAALTSATPARDVPSAPTPTENATEPSRALAPLFSLPMASASWDDGVAVTVLAPNSAVAQRQTGEHPAVTILPGSRTGEIIAIHPPRKRPRANRRIHRFVVLAIALSLVVAVMTIAPLNRMVVGGTYTDWLANAAHYDIPTATPTPSPTPVVYPAHPVVSGAWNFICVALPFARLAQTEMLNAGMTHPWHVSMILGQWGIEQGWTIPGYTGYNWGNVGGIPGYPAVGGLNVWGSPDAFAYAYTPRQGVEEYVYVAQLGYYANVTANWGNGAKAQAYALGQSPWDAAHYNNGGGAGSSIVGVMNAFNLYQFDNPNARC